MTKAIDAAQVTRTTVKSSQLISVGYESGVLVVEFTGGTVYRYDEVPQETYDALMAAESKGKYFGEHVKKAGFTFKKIGLPAKEGVA
jgi:hypothetical protein